MVKSVAHNLIGDAVFALIPVVAVQRAVDQGRQNNQRAEEQASFHG